MGRRNSRGRAQPQEESDDRVHKLDPAYWALALGHVACDLPSTHPFLSSWVSSLAPLVARLPGTQNHPLLQRVGQNAACMAASANALYVIPRRQKRDQSTLGSRLKASSSQVGAAASNTPPIRKPTDRLTLRWSQPDPAAPKL